MLLVIITDAVQFLVCAVLLTVLVYTFDEVINEMDPSHQ